MVCSISLLSLSIWPSFPPENAWTSPSGSSLFDRYICLANIADRPIRSKCRAYVKSRVVIWAILRSRSDLVRISGKFVVKYAGSDHYDQSAICHRDLLLYNFSHLEIPQRLTERILRTLRLAIFFLLFSVILHSANAILPVVSGSSEFALMDKFILCDPGVNLANKTSISRKLFPDQRVFFFNGIELSKQLGQAKV